jgi:hypothetical protein
MKSIVLCFNIIFLTLGLCACGKTNPKKPSRNPKKQAATISFHLEVNRDGTGYNQPVPIFRERPMMVNVERVSVLDTADLEHAEVVDADAVGGGHALRLVFNNRGAIRLADVSTENKGRRIAIACQWTEVRWLAAPRITHNIVDGVFVFTPDATHEECERIARGLNNVIKELKKPYTF